MTKQQRQNAYNEFIKLYREAVDPTEIKDVIETGYYKFYTDPVTGMEFVFVKGGCYEMGDTFGNGYSEEKPVHEVCVDDFYMGKYEVTNGEYRKFKRDHDSGTYKGHSLNSDDQPVVDVSWDDAKAFARWLSDKTGKRYRLPTEAEWEYACRSGGKKEKYCGGSDIDALGWYNDNSGGKTHSVGKKKANGLGLYDMIGNVFEWVEDVYNESAYSSHSRNNPIYAGSGDHRVLRGGSWNFRPYYVRASLRVSSTPDGRYNVIGFRLVSEGQ